ncbi:MAG: HAD-IA family hydrolase [Methyloprofundus sp.]|nr:HAD-IA family hydrolase [Methyloprofundus sp.]
MSQLPDFKAIIFDMDGLIIDTETTYFAAWQQAATALGYHISDSFCVSLSGLDFSLIEVKLAEYFSVSFPFKEFYSLSARIWRARAEREGIAVKKGVHDLVSVLHAREIPYCLATNSPELNARECLQYAAVDDLFTKMVCRDHVQMPKPAPDLFLQAARVLQQPIENCLVIEDSLIGLLAASNANAFSVLVPSMPDTDGRMQGLAGVVVNDLIELSVMIKPAY